MARTGRFGQFLCPYFVSVSGFVHTRLMRAVSTGVIGHGLLKPMNMLEFLQDLFLAFDHVMLNPPFVHGLHLTC